MTTETKREAAIRMAREANCYCSEAILPGIERLIAIAQAEQREKDAGICREIAAHTHEDWPDDFDQGYAQGLGAAHNAIRAQNI